MSSSKPNEAEAEEIQSIRDMNRRTTMEAGELRQQLALLQNERNTEEPQPRHTRQFGTPQTDGRQNRTGEDEH